jgi:ABC-type nitrate/sulfonate/bicarbonate transport system substrate-binding protein
VSRLTSPTQRRHTRWRSMLLLPALATLAGCGAGAGEDAATSAADESSDVSTIRFLMPRATWQLQIQQLVQNDALADKHGLEIEPTTLKSPQDVLQAMAAGAGDIGMTVPDTAVAAQLKGIPITVISGVADLPPWEIIGGPDVTSVEQIRDKNVSVVQSTGAATAMLELSLEANGLPPGSYKMVTSGGPSARLAALNSGAVAATFLPPPQSFIAEANGLNRLVPFARDVKQPSIVLVANEEWAKNNPEAVVRFLEAVNEATEFVYDEKNRKAVIDAAAAFNEGAPPEALDKTYDFLVHDIKPFPADGAIQLSDTIELMLSTGQLEERVEPEDFVDLTYQQAAESE